MGLLLDDAHYLSAAQALARGEGYIDPVLPGSPPQTKYPPGYAWLLTWICWWSPVFPAQLSLILLHSWFWVTASIPLLVWVFQEEFGVNFATAIFFAALHTINPFVVLAGVTALSEAPFLFFLLTSVLLASLASKRNSAALAAGAGLAGMGAFLLRTAALAWLPAMVAAFLLRRQYRLAGLAAMIMTPAIVAWQLWVATHRPINPDPVMAFYLDYTGFYRMNIGVQDLLSVLRLNTFALLNSIGRMIWFTEDTTGGMAYRHAIVVVLVLYGNIRLALRRRISFLQWYALFSLPLILVWHFPPNERFLLPLLPLLIGGAAEALRPLVSDLRILASKRGDPQRIAATGILAGLIAMVGWICWQNVDASFGLHREVLARDHGRLEELRPVYQWARSHLGPDARVLAFQEGRFYLWTGREAINPPRPTRTYYRERTDEALQFFLSYATIAMHHGLGYLLRTPWDLEGDLPAQERSQYFAALDRDSSLEPVFSTGEGIVLYRIALREHPAGMR